MAEKADKIINALSRNQLLGTIPSGLFLVNREKTILYWNPEAERITGYSASDVIGQHCSILEGIECGSGCRLFDPGTPEKPIINAECVISTKSGDRIIISKNVDLLYEDGEVIGGIESFIDITRQKKLEEKLRRHGEELEETVRQRTAALDDERTRLRSVLDAMGDPAYIVTADYRIDFLNKAMEKLVGNATGKSCHQTIYDLDSPCPECPWEEIRKSRSIHNEQRFGRNDRVYEILHTPVYSPQGELEKLAVCRDITERKEATEKLQELNRHLDSFVYTVSHDLRSPLTPIIGFAEFLQDEYRDKLDDQAISLLKEIESQGGRMLKLMEDLLQLSRVGHLPPPDEPVDVKKIIDQLILEKQFEMSDRNIRFTVGEMPKLRIPESLISELFGNLIHNAMRYGCQPGDSIEIESDPSSANTISVIDHGPGIPEKEREKVCNVFFRGTTSKDIAGTGIGLATVHKIVRLYDGSIRIEETPGGGCTFVIQFPDNQD